MVKQAQQSDKRGDLKNYGFVLSSYPILPQRGSEQDEMLVNEASITRIRGSISPNFKAVRAGLSRAKEPDKLRPLTGAISLEVRGREVSSVDSPPGIFESRC